MRGQALTEATVSAMHTGMLITTVRLLTDAVETVTQAADGCVQHPG